MKLSSRLFIVTALAAAIGIGATPSFASDLAPSSVVEPAAHTGSAAHADLLQFLLAPIADPNEFDGKRVAIVASDGASAFELETTRDYFMDRGARVDVLTPRPAESTSLVGLAGFVPPWQLLQAPDYAGERRLVAVTWYLDQVKPQDYDAIYVPNNLEDIERLRTNGQTIRFLVLARAAGQSIFVTGNAKTIVPGFAVTDAPQLRGAVSVQSMRADGWQIYAGQDAFDMPELIGALGAALTAAPDRQIN